MKSRGREWGRVFLDIEPAWTKAGCGQRACYAWDSGVTVFHNHKPQMDIPYFVAILLLSLTKLVLSLTKIKILYHLSSNFLSPAPSFSKIPKSHQAAAPSPLCTKTTNQPALTFSNACLVMMGLCAPLFILEFIPSHLLGHCPAGSPHPCISNGLSQGSCPIHKHTLAGLKSQWLYHLVSSWPHTS